MSRFRLPTLRGMASSVKKNLRNRSRRGRAALKPRRMRIDPLEERMLLSLAPADLEDVLVNQHFDQVALGNAMYTDPVSLEQYPQYVARPGQPTTFASDRPYRSGQSLGGDHDGDMVVAWAQDDEILRLALNPDGTVQKTAGEPVYVAMVDPRTGFPQTFDSNIYARYFTDEVQRITLPDEVLTNASPANARFSLVYGGNEVQKLSITAGWAPSTYGFGFGYQENIAGSFTLGFDLDGSGTIGPGETTTVVFDETDFGARNLNLRPDHILQTQLQGLGGALADVRVEAVDPHQYLVHFGNASLGENQPEVRVISSNFTSGFLPAVMISTVRESITLANVPVSPTSAALTANAIQQAFSQLWVETEIGPVDFQPPDLINRGTPGPYYAPLTVRRPRPEVSVTPVLGIPGHADGTVFDVTFVGASGKRDQPEMLVSAVVDESGNSLIDSAQLSVRTMKESSAQFRVNPDEPLDELTGALILANQNRPSVAMDSDGDYVIAWTSEVPQSVNPGSITDIFARRFSAMAVVPESQVAMTTHLDDDGIADPVQGVRPLGGEFQVNTFTTNVQASPSVGMDGDGNFLIAWSNIGQDLSYFNRIAAQRYDRDGNRLGGELRVTPEQTAVQLNPVVAGSLDGHFAIAWETTNDPAYFLNAAYVTSVSGRIYGVDPVTKIWGPTSPFLAAPGSGGSPTLSFDTANNLAIGWVVADGGDTIATGGSTNTYAIEYTVTGTLHRAVFRLNSGTRPGATSVPLWSYDQWMPALGLDADGDLVATFWGNGPDVSDYIYIQGTIFQDQINATRNADLLPFFNPAFDSLPSYSGFFLGNYVDVDGVIESVLINAFNSGATTSQLARLGAILESGAGLLRGDSEGVFFTRWDSDPILGTQTVLTSDDVANAKRDGHNTRYLISFPMGVTDGGFTLAVDNPLTVTQSATVDIAPVYNNNFLDVYRTRDEIENKLRTLTTKVGLSWPRNLYNGPISVRVVSSFERQERLGTPWDISSVADATDVIYEVTFQGDVHDLDMYMWMTARTIQVGDVDVFPNVEEYMLGDTGITQRDVSLAIEPSGSFAITWTQIDEFTSTSTAGSNIYFRRFAENTDTAGPLVTDFLLPTGERLRNGQQVNADVPYLVVTLDEEMMRAGANGVTNADNWVLLRDGVAVLGGVADVEFGMNRAADLSSILGVATVGSNKWEAVLFLDGDGVAGGDVPAPLSDGHYEIVALSSMRDRAGNPLGRTGYNPNGNDFSRSFDVLVPRGEESRVNDDPAGNQFTLDHSPKATAGDGNGNYVAVWTSDKPGEVGVWAKLYGVTWWEDPDTGRESQVSVPLVVVDPVTGATTVVPPIRVTTDPTATYASVARDADGDFVVTWSQKDVDPKTSLKTDWNVWARRFTATGEALDDGFRVNSETRNIQRASTVAMDVEGDFVITWQSMNQDKSGYGVYAQRYTPAGNAIGGDDEVQMLTFVNNPRGYFILEWDDDDDPATPPKRTLEIAYNGNTFATADKVRQALEGLGAEVVVQAISRTEIAIRFTGKDGSKDQAPLVVLASVTGDPDAAIVGSTRGDGSAGEFRVNDTTLGNQMFPDIAMSADGTFVVTWTAYGQAGDQAFQTNVVAKKFISNQLLRPSAGANTSLTSGVVASDPTKQFVIVTTDDPGNHVVGPGSGYDGVVRIDATTGWMGSGTLLSTGMHILTAAHVVALQNSPIPLPAGALSVTFDMPTGSVTLGVTRVFVNPAYTGVAGTGADVAILTLANPAPAQAERYDIYRTANELGRGFTKAGYGMSGMGDAGMTIAAGTKRTGENRYDLLGPQDPNGLGVPADTILYDFDNGLAANDLFGTTVGLVDLGLGDREASGAPGDSGGPSFINGLVAAVTSWIAFVPNSPADVVPGINASFGDYGGDIRVSSYATWIDGITLGGSGETIVNSTITGNQRWSTIAMDSDGDFTVTWTSYGQDGGGSSYGPGANGENGVYARRYTSQFQPVAAEYRVNTFTQGNQQYSRIAMDADGDFVITWESFQDRPAPGTGPDSPTSYGIFAQRYARTSLIGTNPLVGTPNGELSTEFAVNTTKDGPQRYPSVAMNATGDFEIVWSGRGPGDVQGVFYKRYENLADDTGPIVSDTLAAVPLEDGQVSLRLVRDGSVLTPMTSGPNRFVIEFDEDLSTEGGVNGQHSILNPINWDLSRNGAIIRGGVTSIHFGLSQARVEWPGSGADPTTPAYKYQAVITLDSDTKVAGLQPLTPGSYVLTLRDAVQDVFGNALDGNYDGSPGVDFQRKFLITGPTSGGPGGPGDPLPTDKDTRVNPQVLFEQDSPAIAADSDGNYVVVWVEQTPILDNSVTPPLILGYQRDVQAQRFNPLGQKQGSPFVVHTYTTGDQIQPDVAMDPFGNFVVVWAGEGATDDRGVFARRFDPFGVPLGTEFRVNASTVSTQNRPAVALDSEGNVIVTWTHYDQAGEFESVMARRFDQFNDPLTDEFRINTYTRDAQDRSDVAVDVDGNYAVVWQSEGQDGSGWGVYGQRLTKNDVRLGGEFRINDYTPDKQRDPKVAMDADGDFVVVWSSFLEDGSGYGVYGKRYTSAGVGSGEFRANVSTTGWQHQPGVAISRNGSYVVTWSPFGQEPKSTDYGIFARLFNADGSDLIDTGTGRPFGNGGEFRINAGTLGNQVRPAVAMAANGDFAVAWEGPDDPLFDPLDPLLPPGARNVGVFLRAITVNTATPAGGTSAAFQQALVLNGFTGWSGGWSDPGRNNGPVSIAIVGTSGDDTFVFKAGATPDTWVVQLNGVDQVIDPQTAVLNFDGRGGYDTVFVEGTSANEKLELWPDHGTLTGTGWTFNVANSEAIDVKGKGGVDEAFFHDSDGDDTFTASSAAASLTNGTFSFTTSGFRRAEATATAGHDQAVLTDSAGTDNFTAYPDHAEMTGPGYSLKATGFDGVQARSFAGGDVARLYDSDGDDTFEASGNDTSLGTPAAGTLVGSGFSNQAIGFRYLYAYGSGGHDVATLYDSTANDMFIADPAYAAMYSTAYYNRANAFDSVEGRSRNGIDVAKLTGSAGSETLVADSTKATLSGTTFSNAASNFRYVMAMGGGGSGDAATLNDSSAADAFVGTPVYATLSGPAYLIRVSSFPTVRATSANGGTDIARLYDSAGNDTFTASPDSAKLTGTGYSDQADKFDFVYAFASLGTDTATLTDSAGADTLLAYAASTALYGAGYYNRAYNFDSVEAISAAGSDTAKFYDSVANDTFVASPTAAAMSDGTYSGGAFTAYSYLNKATNFRYVQAASRWDPLRSGGSDVAELYDSAGNDTFTGTPTSSTLTNGTYILRVNNFGDVRAHASIGNDTARLIDSALNDLLEADDNWARLSNVDLKMAMAAYGFDKVTATSSNSGDKKHVVLPLDFVLETTGPWTDI